MNETIQQIPLDQLTPSPHNRRVGGFDPVKLQQLADSIKSLGVQVPAVVRHQPDDIYEIVAGERRWRASKLAKVEALPCVVRKLTDAEVIKIRAVENVQREDVHPLDEAESYQQLIDACGYEVETVAAELGKSVSYVYQRLKLKDLIPKAREMLIEGKITAGHAILIARLGQEQQEEVLKDGLLDYDDEVVSVRELSENIQQSILMDLSKTTWKADDVALVPAAGSCTACPKRTGYVPELFADVGKKDHCTDRACFAAKGAAMVERRRAELKEEPHLEVRDGYSRAATVPGALAPHDWAECKKKDEGAVRVLVVDGPQPGRLTWGKANSLKAAALNPKVEAKVRAERAKEKKILAARKSLILTIYEEIQAEVVGRIKARKEGDDVLGFRRLVALQVWERVGFDTQNFIAKMGDWPKPAPSKNSSSISWDQHARKLINEADTKALDLFLFICTFAGGAGITVNNYFYIPKRFEAAAKLFDIDIEAMVAKKLKDEGLKKKELLPPVPDYMKDDDDNDIGQEDEDE